MIIAPYKASSPAIRAEVLTQSGRYFNLLTPFLNEYDIEDIAHALAHLCRFGGHTYAFYSVAQHSVLCSQLVPHMDAYAALMHDAAEAFLGDVPSPLKQLLPDYRRLETEVEQAIFQRFGVPHPLPASVKYADRVMLNSEQQDLMPPHADTWPLVEGLPRWPEAIEPWTPLEAKAQFLSRYWELRHG